MTFENVDNGDANSKKTTIFPRTPRILIPSCLSCIIAAANPTLHQTVNRKRVITSNLLFVAGQGVNEYADKR